MKEPCLICNAEARAALKEDVRQFAEEIVAEMPADRVPGLSCWNCLGTGFTGLSKREKEKSDGAGGRKDEEAP